MKNIAKFCQSHNLRHPTLSVIYVVLSLRPFGFIVKVKYLEKKCEVKRYYAY